jgi:hypothetical protein
MPRYELLSPAVPETGDRRSLAGKNRAINRNCNLALYGMRSAERNEAFGILFS